MQVAGDVHRAGPGRQGGGQGRRCAGGAGPAPGVRLKRGAGQNEAGEAVASDHVRHALPGQQAELAEEVTRLHPPHAGHPAAGMLHQTIGGPVEDQVQRVGGLTLLHHGGARGEPLHPHVVPGQPHGGRLAGEQGDRLQRGAVGGPLSRIGDPVRELLGHGRVPGREHGVVQPLAPVMVAGQRPERLGGQAGDRDVVGVAVTAVVAEGDDGVRIELPHDVSDHGAQRGPVVRQGPVRVVQHLHALHAEFGGGRAQLALPDRAQRAPGGGGRIADLPPLPAGGRDDHDLGARLGGPGHRAGRAEHLVVRVGEDAEQAPR